MQFVILLLQYLELALICGSPFFPCKFLASTEFIKFFIPGSQVKIRLYKTLDSPPPPSQTKEELPIDCISGIGKEVWSV